jgi:hypothetical protein
MNFAQQLAEMADKANRDASTPYPAHVEAIKHKMEHAANMRRYTVTIREDEIVCRDGVPVNLPQLAEAAKSWGVRATVLDGAILLDWKSGPVPRR